SVLYLESFGNPRKFARTATRVSARMPVLTVHAGRSAPGQRAATSHTAAAAGLSVATPSRHAATELAAILPPGAALGGPVDTTATVRADTFGTALATVGGDTGVDAVLALVVRTAAADLVPALTAARLAVPLAAVRLDQPDSVRLLRSADGAARVPAYAYPESAARALSRAARYGSWRSRPAEAVPDIAGLRVAEARGLIASFLDRMPGGGWLP